MGFDLDDDRPAPTLSRNETEAVLARLRATMPPLLPERLGFIGKTCLPLGRVMP